jgi:regulatory protein
MKINKLKKIGKNKYRVYFNNTDLVLYEDIILKYELLLKSDIDEELIDEIIEDNRNYEVYDMALSYIEVKMRTRKELFKYLTNKGFSPSLVNETLDKIDKLGLLDNKAYIRAYINDKVNLSNDGPYKIKSSLMDLDFNENDIDDYLWTIDNNIWSEKLDKLINKKKTIMKSKSYYMFINKMKNDLYNMGYDKEMIDDKLSHIEYESNALEKDLEKAKKKYISDKNKIISSLLRKGYSYEEINSKI